MKEKRPKRADLDVKYILKTYWSFLRKYKPLILGILICGFLLPALGFAQRSFFKKIIDSGELFIKNQMVYSKLLGIITTIAILWVAVILVRSVIRWFRTH